MNAPGFDARYEPGAVKAALPVEWALGHLFGVWGVGQEMVSCPLPGHSDSTASFNLWAPNDEGLPMRYGCFGCGENGDVIDLIRAARGVGFTDACTIAVDELVPALRASGWVPSDPVEQERAQADPLVLEERLRGYNDQHGLRPFLEAKNLLRLGTAFPAERWGWRAGYAGMPVVVFPHRDYEGVLRGIRYRSVRRGNRWTEKGSRFDSLYGAWHDEMFKDVLLCEGETDTVMADWELTTKKMDVMGLASGAAQRPPAAAVEQLRGRSVTLAFDNDMAGRIATNRWIEALKPWVEDLLVCQLAEGDDLCSSSAPVEDLVRGAVSV